MSSAKMAATLRWVKSLFKLSHTPFLSMVSSNIHRMSFSQEMLKLSTRSQRVNSATGIDGSFKVKKLGHFFLNVI